MPTTHNLDNFHQKQTCNFIASYFNSQDMFQILWVKLQWLVSVREKVGTQSGDNGKCMVRDKNVHTFTEEKILRRSSGLNIGSTII